MTAGAEAAGDEPSSAAAKTTTVILETSMGDIELALHAAKAPQSVANFLAYVDEGYYDGTIFHRVIDGFMIQGGGFAEDMLRKPTRAPIQNEADNGLQNVMGSIAMARTNAPHSATSQFFINVADNVQLDHSGKNPAQWGYAVFGSVISGMEVVDAIKAVPTRVHPAGHANVPVEAIVIKRAFRKP
ncbi:MAG: peptidylprolyl isomerase [Pseudomonadales bacterium]